MARLARDEAPTDQRALLRTISDAVLAVTADPRVERSLRHLVEAARTLAGARYAAIGIPDEESDGFAEFIYTGMTDELVERIGPLPRRHGLLAAMLSEPDPFRTPDIRKDPRFEWWPDAHPRMSSFLGVPIVYRGDVVGAFYLTDKIGAREFTAEDQEAIELLAAHAAVAIETTRLYGRSRQLSIVEERNRLARELHDSVTQTLFSMSLRAEAALQMLETDLQTAREEVAALRDLARQAVQEMRSLVFELRPPDLEAEGLAETLRKHIDVVRRVSHNDITLAADGYERQPVEVEREVLRIAQEALNNAVKHAEASCVRVNLTTAGGALRLEVADDGGGFDPDDAQIRGKRLGITSMEERAEELGGELTIDSRPGQPTTVRLEVPLG
jgi:signal transduction histidine kinase